MREKGDSECGSVLENVTQIEVRANYFGRNKLDKFDRGYWVSICISNSESSSIRDHDPIRLPILYNI